MFVVVASSENEEMEGICFYLYRKVSEKSIYRGNRGVPINLDIFLLNILEHRWNVYTIKFIIIISKCINLFFAVKITVT